jgi:glutamine synthetase
MKTVIEYVWLDGYEEPNLRSKIKVLDKSVMDISNIPNWSFDGSSAKMAETIDSDCILKPVKMYRKDYNSKIYVLCEVLNTDETPHVKNHRSKLIPSKRDSLMKIIKNQQNTNEDFWFGFEQEYFIRKGRNQQMLGHDTIVEGQGKYYCGVGINVAGREFAEEHMEMCMDFGINITGINAEVAMGQWEYQVFSKGPLDAGDDLWMTRYFLHILSEKYGYEIDLHPKPLQIGEWNGSGLHTNFSNERMRTIGGETYFQAIFSGFEVNHLKHIEVYGKDNHLRLTGNFETQSIDKFTWGISDRGASIRVPRETAKEWKGYLEDRRPSANANPYLIINEILKTFEQVEQLVKIRHAMYDDVDTQKIRTEFNGILSNEELLNVYQNDDIEDKDLYRNEKTDDIELTRGVKTIYEPEEIKFDLNGKE